MGEWFAAAVVAEMKASVFRHTDHHEKTLSGRGRLSKT